MSQQFVTIRPGGTAAETDGILYQPSGRQRPLAVLFAHKWGTDYDDPFPTLLGPALAERGVATLSYRLRRHGGVGQLDHTPDDDADDLRQAVGYLAAAGHRDLVVGGEGVGALSAAIFLNRSPAPAVRGLLCV